MIFVWLDPNPWITWTGYLAGARSNCGKLGRFHIGPPASTAGSYTEFRLQRGKVVTQPSPVSRQRVCCSFIKRAAGHLTPQIRQRRRCLLDSRAAVVGDNPLVGCDSGRLIPTSPSLPPASPIQLTGATSAPVSFQDAAETWLPNRKTMLQQGLASGALMSSCARLDGLGQCSFRPGRSAL